MTVAGGQKGAENDGSAAAQTQTEGARRIGLRIVAKQGLRFLGAGLITFPVGIGVSALAHEILGMPEKVAAATALTVLLVLGFLLSRRYVFLSNGRIARQAWRFLLVAAAARGTEYVLFLAVYVFGGVNYLLSLIIALGISFGFKFILYRGWVFTHRDNQA